MLHSRNLSSVLAQSITPNTPPDKSIVSSILITPSGQPIASYHSKRPPPPPKTLPTTPYLYDSLGLGEPSIPDHHITQFNPNGIDTGDGVDLLDTSSPFQVTRSGKTKVYSLFASSAWKEYQEAGMGKPVFTQVTGRNNKSNRKTAGHKSGKHGKKSKHSSNDDQPRSNNESLEDAQKQREHLREWISFITDDSSSNGAIIFIMGLRLKSSGCQLLLVLVGDGDCPLGIILKKAEETAVVLEEGLDTYRISE